MLPPLALFAAALQDEIVVTGRGLGVPRGNAAYDVIEIGRTRLANSPSNRLEDVLRDIPGFQQFRRSDSRTANPTSQGATFRALGGNASSRALLLLDGVPQTDPFGGWIAWPAYDPRRLGRIRVTRGGGSGAAGPGALSGTVELESALLDEALGPYLGLAYGSRDSVDAHAGLGMRLGAGGLMATASYARGDGFIPVVAEQRGPADRPSPYEQASAGLRAVAPAGGAELQANLSAFTDARERGTAFSAIRNRGADASLRLVGRGALPFALLGYVQVREFANEFASVNATRTAATQTLDQYSVPATGLGARAELRPHTGPIAWRLGADWRETTGRTQELFQYAAGVPTRIREAGGRTRTLGAFAEADWGQEPLTLTAGARLDRWTIDDGRLEERALATGTPLTEVAFADRAGWESTGRAGIAWQVASPLSLRAAGYLGWRLPTLNELYRPFRVGTDATAANATLAPERLRGAEIGFDYRPREGAWLGITLFANRLVDAIANVTLGNGPGTFPGVGFVAGTYRQRQNVKAITSHGFEVDASLTCGPWRLAAGYSFADAEVRARGAAALLDGLRPAQAPRHSASASLSWTGPGAISASLGVRYAGAQFEDDLNRQPIRDALTVDAIGVLPLAGGLALEVRGENLTDALVVAGISGAGIVERGTPRTLWLGLRWRG